MDQSRIRAKLKQYSIAAFFERYAGRPPSSYSELVLQHVTGGNPIRSPDLVTWFHATRVPTGTTFSEGLLPLPQRVPAITALLRSLMPSCLGAALTPPADNSFWAQEGGRQHGWKMSSRDDWGPDAFLVCDAILHRDHFVHDYLAAPEIVEDLAGMLAGDARDQLVDCFRAATRPCIVEFRSAKPRPDTMRAALYYAYSSEWGLGSSIEANTCYSGEGEAIPAEDILDVAFLPEVL